MCTAFISPLLQPFHLHLLENEKSSATIEKYLRDLRSFLRFSADNALTKQTVLDYKNHLADHYAVSSANSMLASLNAFFRFAGRPELCIRQLKAQRKAYIPQEKELGKPEYERLVRAARLRRDERLCLMIQTICGTGIRVSELQHITVEAVRRGEATVRCKGKIRPVFLVQELRTALLHYARRCGITSGPVFITRTGRPVSRTAIWRQMKTLCQQAQVLPCKVFPHNLRHLFARIFYAAEKDIAKLADILGHTSINTTRIYVATTGAEHRRRMEQLGLILPCTAGGHRPPLQPAAHLGQQKTGSRRNR